MAIYLSVLALPGYASYHPPSAHNNMDWDLLYVAAGLILFLLVVAGAATLANARDERRHPRTH